MQLPLKSLFSLPVAIRCAEAALAVALALALADLVWLLAPATGAGENPATGAAGPDAPALPAPAALSGKATSRNLSPAMLGLFGQAQGGGPAPAYATGEVRETDLDLTLKGILASRAGARKLALVAQGEATEKVYRVGDRIAGAAITHIEARRLILLRNGAREALTLETAEPRRGSSFNSKQTAQGITMLSDHERVVSRQLVDRRLQRDGQEVTVDFSIQ